MQLKSILFVGILLPALLWPALGNGQNPPQQKQEQKDEYKSPYRVKIFEVKHRPPNVLAEALAGLLSGTGPSRINPNQQLNTITVRDYPENLAAIEEALKRLDVPETRPPAIAAPSIEFQLHLIAASQTSMEKATMPPGLDAVVTQLKATLKYTNYRYLTTLSSRVRDGGTIEASGAIDTPFQLPNLSTRSSSYNYAVLNVGIVDDASGRAFQTRQFRFTLSVPVQLGNDVQYRDIGLKTDLSVREGENAVVGTANVGGSDTAIIIVVNAKKVK